MNIFIIGMPGSGKSTIAQLLADKLAFKMYDTDLLIEKAENKTISQIFKDDGEDYFRRLEHDLLYDWPYFNCVVATGGGMPCFFDNLLLMHDYGKTIYLEASVDTLTQRLEKGINRPLIAEKTEKSIKDWVEYTLNKRHLYYEQNSITVNANQDPLSILKYIMNNIQQLGL